MVFKNSLIEKADGSLWHSSHRWGPRREVCTVSEACKILKRSRRQLYRYLQSGVLEPAGKMLGEWLLDLDSVTRLSQSPLAVQPIPAKLQTLLPEYQNAKLNAGRDATLLMSRVLENGSLEELRWLFRRYSKKQIAHFVEEDGARLLSPRAINLWTLYLGVKTKPCPPWRTESNPWPGVKK